MHYHPETLLVLHQERAARFEAEAARYALVKALRQRRRQTKRSRRPGPLKPLPVRLRPLL